MLATKRIKLTYEDYVLFPNDGKRHEIIEGEHIMEPSPMTRHQVVSRNLEWLIEAHIRQTGVGHVFDAPFDVVLSDTNIVQPDLVYVSKEHSEIITEKNICGTPDLVVEILSKSTTATDRILKRDLYAQFGVREYWIVDPDAETVEVYVWSPDRYRKKKVLRREDRLTTKVIPGLVIALEEVFPEAMLKIA